MLITKIVKFFTSLRLTAVLLAFAIILVFVGTLAQADDGLYGAQAHYFKAWFIFSLHLFGHKFPVLLPGGYLIGTLLLVNLVVTHIYRFELTAKKAGIQLAHAGIILLLVGQLATDLMARELQMHLAEGETRDYSDSASEYELNFFVGDQVVAIPETLLKPGRDLTAEKTGLPFAIRVKSLWRNSDLTYRAPMMQNGPALTTNGVGANFDFKPVADASAMDQRNIPTAVLEFLPPAGSLGTWVVSDWATDPALVESLRSGYAQMGAAVAQRIAAQLAAPQTLTTGGQSFTFALRAARVRHPFSLTLLKASHTVYPGTDIPKDFRSRVRIDNSATKEQREVEISMNHPLRYGGYTYYQYQMDAGQAAKMAGRTPTSVLQVVRNPSWLTPYLGCTMVGAGLVIQFLYHLVGFLTKRKKQ